MRRKAITTLVAAVLLGGVVATASPASASPAPPDGGTWDYTFASSDGGATAYIEKHGDIIELCDTKADGLGARGKVSFLTYTIYPMQDLDGNGTCAVYSASLGGGYDLTEDRTYDIMIGDGPNYEHAMTYPFNNDR